MNHSVRLSAMDLPALMAQLQRGAVGFDRMFETLHRATSASENYPPHNIVKLSDTSYAIEVAVAGFKEDELDVLVENNTLTILGNQFSREEKEYLHQGIACRSFSKVLNLAEHVVVHDAKFEDGLLIIGLEIVVPEELKPRKISISSSKQLT